MTLFPPLERRLREKSIRECGRVKVNDIHEERVEEILRDRNNEQRRDRTRPLDSGDEGVARLWTKAKGFASRKKSTLPVRYSKSREEDEVELLKVNGSEETRSHAPSRSSHAHSPYRGSRGQSKKGIFDDI